MTVPAKLIRVYVRQLTPVSYYSAPSQWAGYPYQWDVTLSVTAQSHGDGTTSTPYAYTAQDIKPGDYIVTGGQGRLLKILSATPTGETYCGCLVEDENQTNILQDDTSSGYGGITTGEGFVFETKNGWPIIYPIPNAIAGSLPPYFASDILSRFLAVRPPDVFTGVSSDTGINPITPTEFRIETTSNGTGWDTTTSWGLLSFYSNDASVYGPQIQAAIGATAFDASGGTANLVFKTWDGVGLTDRLTIDRNGKVYFNTVVAARADDTYKYQFSAGKDTRLLVGTGSNLGDSVCGVEFQDRLGGVDVPHDYGQITGFVRCIRNGSAADFKLALGAAYTTNLDAQNNVIIRGSSTGGKLGVNIEPAAPLHVYPAANAEAIRVWNSGGISSIGGGYSALTQNAYSFGDPFKFKRLTANASVGVGVITAARSPLNTNTGGVWVTAGGTDVNAEINWADMTPAITWSGSGEICIGHETPSMGDIDLSVKPLLHVKKSGNTGATNWLARFQAGADADYTSAGIVLNHDNDRGIFIEGGRQFGNTAFGGIGLISNIGLKIDALTLREDSANQSFLFGVGKAFPQYKLDVAGQIRGGDGTNTSAKPVFVTDIGGSGCGMYSSGQNILRFATSSADRVSITPEGNTHFLKKSPSVFDPGYITRDPNQALWLSSRLCGRVVNYNPQFINGDTTGYAVYNLLGNGNLTHVLVSEGAEQSAQYIPNATGRCLKIMHNGGATAPEGGGFMFQTSLTPNNTGINNRNKYRAKQRHIIKIVANIPPGFNLGHASNSTGVGQDLAKYHTNNAGLGTWAEYIISAQLGAGLSATHYFYITPRPQYAINWFVASCEIIDVDSPREVIQSPELTVGYDSTYNAVNAGWGSLGVANNILTGGKIGINTTQPDSALHLVVDNPAPRATGLIFEGTSWGSDEQLDFLWRRGGFDYASIGCGLSTNLTASKIFFQTTTNSVVDDPVEISSVDGALTINTPNPASNIFTKIGNDYIAVAPTTSHPDTTNWDYAGQYIAVPGGTYNSRAASQTGNLRITLPTNWRNTMIRFSVTIFEYRQHEGKTFHVQGYGYNANTDSQRRWIAPSALVTSDYIPDDTGYYVHFGRNNTANKMAIWIEKTGSGPLTWAYPQIRVHDVLCGFFNTHASIWTEPWEVAFTADAPEGNKWATGINAPITIPAHAPLTYDSVSKESDSVVKLTNARATTLNVGNISGTFSPNLQSGNLITAQLVGDVAVNMPAPVAGQSFTLVLGTGSGGYSVTYTGGLLRWASNRAPLIPTTPQIYYVLTFFSPDGVRWFGTAGGFFNY